MKHLNLQSKFVPLTIQSKNELTKRRYLKCIRRVKDLDNRQVPKKKQQVFLHRSVVKHSLISCACTSIQVKHVLSIQQH